MVKDELELNKLDYQARRVTERSYVYRVIGVMKPGVVYTMEELTAICNVPQSKIYSALKVLVSYGGLERIEPKPINYPGWFEDAGMARKIRWRKQNNIDRRTPTKWRRKVPISEKVLWDVIGYDDQSMNIDTTCVSDYGIPTSKVISSVRKALKSNVVVAIHIIREGDIAGS